MNRRSLLAALASLPAASALAEHGWEPYEMVRPFFLEGRVTTIIWADPHAYLELLHQPRRSGIPADLRARAVPKQKEKVDVAALLDRAVVPAQSGEIWRVELPSLARLSKWGLPRPKIKQVISVIGYIGPQLQDTKTVRAEILFMDAKAYPLRSDPA